MMKNTFIIIFFFFCIRLVWSDIHEYQLLWEDLANAKTYGYKSHFDIIELTGKSCPSKHPIPALIETRESCRFAIMGAGFFKIALSDTTVGYTRNGNFNARFDLETKTWELTTQRGYALADPVSLLYTVIKKRGGQGQEEIIGIIEESSENWTKVIQSAGEYAILLGEFYGPEIAKELKVYDVPYEKRGAIKMEFIFWIPAIPAKSWKILTAGW